jgi:uncharacterized membrane protein
MRGIYTRENTLYKRWFLLSVVKLEDRFKLALTLSRVAHSGGIMLLITLTVVQVALLVVVLLVLWLRGRGTSADLVRQLMQMRTQSERIEPALREEMRTSRAESVEQAQQSRKEAREDARSLREELLSTVNTFGEKTCEAVGVSRREQAEAGEQSREQVIGQLEVIS